MTEDPIASPSPSRPGSPNRPDPREPADALNLPVPRGARSLPPAYWLAYGLGMVAIDALLPIEHFELAAAGAIGTILCAAGFLLVVPSRLRFARRGTTIRPFEVSNVLVRDGLFRYSRNPMYLGLAVNLLGLAIVLGSLGALALVPVFVLHVQHRFIVREERALEERFGGEYRSYAARVRRWL